MTRVFDRARDLYLAQQQQEGQTVSQNELLDHIMDGRIPMLSFEANEADSLSRCRFCLLPLGFMHPTRNPNVWADVDNANAAPTLLSGTNEDSVWIKAT